jgi:hypothetical protein
MYGRHSGLFGSSLRSGIFKTCENNLEPLVRAALRTLLVKMRLHRSGRPVARMLIEEFFTVSRIHDLAAVGVYHSRHDDLTLGSLSAIESNQSDGCVTPKRGRGAWWRWARRRSRHAAASGRTPKKAARSNARKRTLAVH